MFYFLGNIMTWYAEFNSSFWLTIAGVVSAAFGLCISSFLKSKCSSVELCCIKCVRDTKAEEEEDLAELGVSRGQALTQVSAPVPDPAPS